MCRRKSLGSPPESFWLCFAFGSQKGGRRLFTVQSDPDYSGADYPFHGFTGLGPLLLFNGFLTFGDAVTQLMPNSRKNEKRLKIFLPYMSNSYKGFDQEQGANCVIKIEAGACWGGFLSLFSVCGVLSPCCCWDSIADLLGKVLEGNAHEVKMRRGSSQLGSQ